VCVRVCVCMCVVCVCVLVHALQLRTAIIRRCDEYFSQVVITTFALLERFGQYSARRVREEERCGRSFASTDAL
jgi:hypothetical protein